MDLERGAGVTRDDNNHVSPCCEDLQSGATAAARLANEVKSGPPAAAAGGTAIGSHESGTINLCWNNWTLSSRILRAFNNRDVSATFITMRDRLMFWSNWQI